MKKFLFRQAVNLLQVSKPKLNILIYHRVMPEPDPLRPWEIDAQQFRQHLEWISGVFHVIPLTEAVQRLKKGTLKRRSLAITFDDGYLDNATQALPLLKEFGFHATFFCTSAWLNGGLMWNDQVIESIRRWPETKISIKTLNLEHFPVQSLDEKNRAIGTILPKLKYLPHDRRQKVAAELSAMIEGLPELMMDRNQIKLLHDNGMEIGGHSHSHPILSGLDDKKLKEEIEQNKQILEEIVPTQLKLFAYPNGKSHKDFRPDQIQHIEKMGYIASVTTEMGATSNDAHLFELPRFTPWDKTAARYIMRILCNNL